MLLILSTDNIAHLMLLFTDHIAFQMLLFTGHCTHCVFNAYLSRECWCLLLNDVDFLCLVCRCLLLYYRRVAFNSHTMSGVVICNLVSQSMMYTCEVTRV